MASRLPPPLDPAQDAAALLRRIGFITLLIAVPMASLVARRAAVVLAPIGVALLVLASLLDNEARPLRKSLALLLRSPVVAAVALVIGWALLSLAWTPFPASASERLGNVLAMLAFGLAGVLALPERMRTANLYLAPIGIGAAALAGIVFQLLGIADQRPDSEGYSIARGLIVLVLLSWPALGWLISRHRYREAAALGVSVAASCALGQQGLAFAAFAMGGMGFMALQFYPRKAALALGLSLAILLAFGPLLPFVLGLLSDTPSLSIWRNSVLAEPLRLITGHGFETVLRGRITGLLPSQTPSSALFEIWYELGIVGVLAASCAFIWGFDRIGRAASPLAASMGAAAICGFALASFGIGPAQSWGAACLAIVMIAFSAAHRAQYRTQRPKANLLALPSPKGEGL